MSSTPSDFDAAKAVCDVLKDLDKERQQRILRWVTESLDLALHVRTERHSEPAPGAHTLPPHAPVLPTTASPRAQDIKSFVDSKAPKSDIQFSAVVAYYYRFEASDKEQKDAISADDLQNATRLAGRARLSRPIMTLNNAKKQGYLDAVERGAFRINSVGENLVAMTLPGSNNAAKAQPPRRRVPAKKAAAGRTAKVKRK